MGNHFAFDQYQPRNLLVKNISSEQIKDIVDNLPEWRAAKKEKILEELKNLSQADKENLIKNGEK